LTTKEGKPIFGTESPDLTRVYGPRPPSCKHEQVNPRSEGQHENVGGNCALCKSPLAKAFVVEIDGRLTYEEPVYIKPAGKSRKRGINPL
jgi:hypothetical protein